MASRFRFRLITLFVLIAVIAVGLAYFRQSMWVPMSSGTIYRAVCYAKDWETLAKSQRGAQQGDCTIYNFGAADPQSLFRDFLVQPNLSEHDIAGESWTSFAWIGIRVADHPVDRLQDWSGASELVVDQISVTGAFLESRFFAKSFAIDCNVWSGTSPYKPGRDLGKPVSETQRTHLFYRGAVAGNLIVFARPIDDSLVQLILIDVR